MGILKRVIQPGNGRDRPKRGDTVTMQYTGHIYDIKKKGSGFRGIKFDSTDIRGDFTTRIGEGQVIKGWDEGILVLDGGMSLGEKATFIISSDYAYGERGFPGLIPPKADLIFDVQLKGINSKRWTVCDCP